MTDPTAVLKHDGHSLSNPLLGRGRGPDDAVSRAKPSDL